MIHSHPRAMRRHLLIGLLVFYLLAVTGCAQYRIQQGDSEDQLPLRDVSSELVETKTLNGYLWGLVEHHWEPTECNLADGTRLGFSKVEISVPFTHRLASIVTLGIWNPVKVTVHCAKPTAVTGTGQ